MTRPLNIAHRGASAYAPENTLAAFRLAEKMGCTGIEFDVQLTRDGVPVIIHDEQLKRTTGRRGRVCEYTLAEIRQLDAGAWFGRQWQGERVPALEEVLGEFSHLFLNVEMKNSGLPFAGIEEKVADLVTRYCNPSNVIVSSFNLDSIHRLKKLAPHLHTGALSKQKPPPTPESIVEAGAMAVHPGYRLLKGEIVKAYHSAGLLVNTWTVNRRGPFERMIQMEVDGIITNYPDVLNEMLDQLF